MPGPPPLVIRDQRREVAANAFRPGWNLPTVSVEEANYIDAQEAMQRHQKEKAKEAKYSLPFIFCPSSPSHNIAIWRERLVAEWGDADKEDDEKVKKDRDFDDWKDLNPKGSGNTGTQGYKY
jgi:immunoglobulin-binding protein 1